jgi:hypothetical protein
VQPEGLRLAQRILGALAVRDVLQYEYAVARLMPIH